MRGNCGCQGDLLLLRVCLQMAHQASTRESSQRYFSEFSLFLRASEEELEVFQAYQRSSAQAAIPWCQEHEVRPDPLCPQCEKQRIVIDSLPPSKVPPRPRRPGSEESGNVTFVEGQRLKEQEHKKLKAKTRDEKKQIWENAMIRNSLVTPYFILGQTIFAFLIWSIFALKDSGDPTKNPLNKPMTALMAGMESMFPGKTSLITHIDCEDHRYDVWRWLTYQWTHVGIGHVGFNAILNLVLGWRLEKLHGNLKMALFYNFGVLGGALCYFVSDVHISVVGMSGGCYSLLGMHWGYLILNFKQKKYRWLTLFVLLVLALVDTINYFINLKKQDDGGPKVSHSAHLGGAFAGLCIVVLFGENLKEDWFEPYLKAFCGIVGFIVVSGCIIIRLTGWPPFTLLDTEGWCWLQLVYNRTSFGDNAWHCVRCGSDACVAQWQSPNQLWTSSVTYAQCLDKHGGFFL